MRTLKFRQRVNGRFHYWGFLVKSEFVGPINPTDPSDQFTGLSDKNGKEIYEGDVVKTRFADTDLVGTIKYADKWARFYFAAPNKYGCPIAFEPETVFCWYYGEDDEEGTSICEVIGNIYENAG